VKILGLRILAKVAIRYASRYMPRDYDINRDTIYFTKCKFGMNALTNYDIFIKQP